MAGTGAIHTRLGRGWSPLRTCVATISCLLMALTLLVVAAASEARAATPEILLGRARVGEYQPVRGDDFLAWQRNTTEAAQDTTTSSLGRWTEVGSSRSTLAGTNASQRGHRW